MSDYRDEIALEKIRQLIREGKDPRTSGDSDVSSYIFNQKEERDVRIRMNKIYFLMRQDNPEYSYDAHYWELKSLAEKEIGEERNINVKRWENERKDKKSKKTRFLCYLGIVLLILLVLSPLSKTFQGFLVFYSIFIILPAIIAVVVMFCRGDLEFWLEN